MESAFAFPCSRPRYSLFAHPFNKMVFKYSLYKLVKQIRCNELVYISVGEVVGEWLDGDKFCV